MSQHLQEQRLQEQRLQEHRLQEHRQDAQSPMNLRTSQVGCFVPHAASDQKASLAPSVVLPADLPVPMPPVPSEPTAAAPAESRPAPPSVVTSWGLDGGYVPACVQPGLYQAEASSWGDDGAYVPPPAEEESESMAEPFLLFA